MGLNAAQPINDTLGAIAEPKRRAILQLVANEELAAGEIAARFSVTRPAISQHLTLLKAAGLLMERREGTRRLYRLRTEGLVELRAFLDELWPDTLERFKAVAEAEPGPSPAPPSGGVPRSVSPGNP